MLALLLYIAIIGLIAWALITLIPMPAQIHTVIIVVAVIASIVVTLHAFGIGLPDPGVPRLR